MDAETHPAPVSQSDGSPDVARRLAQAAAACERRGVRLTELRAQVLRLVLEAGRPVGAYDLLDQLRSQRMGAAPPTVYRALEFLMLHGLIHKIERLSAFVFCPLHEAGHGHDGEHEHAHDAQFLICGRCGTVRELEDDAVRHALQEAAGRLGFTIQGVTIEAEGLCAACAAQPVA